ncbi:hypothetical protein CIW49_13475 [Mycolicibacterium sp. P1-18]|uniref:hypothetical protein n=1 Tax=Mycolicibacterium sp. P1-18 TaxID=2024615 RepID=UPI0011F366D6|nr:hypothetical protein [Mycolicibacterium sp. P1-18]KAA0098885.1 hypothetical protein CIW49_13475 [Mycolicibacterium sp. P1-18]
MHGDLFGSASDVAYVVMDFIAAGRATAHPDHAGVTDLEATVPGDVLVDLLRETETRTGKPLPDASPLRVDRDHRYRVTFVEF